LDLASGERGDKWAAFEVGLVIPRQNGKNAMLEARELAGLFVLGEELILHSAHEFKTSADAFRRLKLLINRVPEYRKQVKKYSESHGHEAIELHDGRRLMFIARTSGSGRGFPADLVVLDEAYDIPASAMNALIPTLTTSPNPQIWYTSSAVDKNIHAYGHTLARIRRRGQAGNDPALLFMEWSADEDRYEVDPAGVVSDHAQWALANPSLGTPILSLEYVEKEQRALGWQGFATERLGIGDWPADEDSEQVIPAEVWQRISLRPGPPSGAVVFAVDVPPSRASASIASARQLPDGRVFVEVIPKPEGAGRGLSWVLARCEDLQDRWHPATWMVDRYGPGASLIEPLEARKLKVHTVDSTEMAVACGGFYDAACALPPQLGHGSQASLNLALSGAVARKLTDRWVWDRRNSSADVSPLVAATLARYGLIKYGRKKPPAPPVLDRTGPTVTERDLASVSF
jgi:hypothetical protein